jgi:hypothetical protein
MNSIKLSQRLGALICATALLTACEGENLFDNSENPFITPHVQVLAPDVVEAGDSIVVNVSASAALNVQRMVLSMRGAVSKDTVITTGGQVSASANVKAIVPYIVSSDMIIVTAQAADIAGRLSSVLTDTIFVVGISGPTNGPVITGIIAPDTTRAGRIVDVRAQAEGALPINQLQFRFRGAANQTITVPVNNLNSVIADAQISIPEGVTDNVLIVSVVARDVNNQFSLLTGASEKTITVFPKVTSP